MSGASEKISAGASAAGDLARTCQASLAGRDPSKLEAAKLEAVRELALALGRTLEGLADEGLAAKEPSPKLLAEAAGKCADLATLAVCNAENLDSPGEARSVVRLAAEAAHSLSRTVEENTTDADLIRRDARSATWKASLAAQQMEDSAT